ncbi:putative late blight resistance protein homolog R1C-3 [Solanum verrucosum]|uniref:putative late blight resistance protein homolog R1C-3 n=1 Tax=Solanum verrucosum TaxID=315347 RepID=UPI0020D10889|nr:putative late blight resistance protein homolog R1C-3 [Solanum verrucosum]
MRTCKIHDLLRQLCLSETHTENVVHVMNGNVPMFLKSIDDQWRVILLSELQENQIYPPMHSNGITLTCISLQSFYYTFPEGIYSIVSEFKLLKVLDVLTFWLDFSSVISELVHLRYVAARIEEGVSLNKLRNLQTIIFKSAGKTELEQPLDIWRMSDIRHLDIGSPLYICNPLEAENESIGEQPLFLNNLQKLYPYNSPFVAEIIRRTPNLKRLKILNDSEHPDWPAIVDSLIVLEKLETLHINLKTIGPNMFSGDILPIKIKKLSPNIKKLRLIGTCIPWEVVKLLANLPNLDVLKGLERWEAAGSDNFPMLEQLFLGWLDELKEIPESIGDILTLNLIQIGQCTSALENSAKRIQEE